MAQGGQVGAVIGNCGGGFSRGDGGFRIGFDFDAGPGLGPGDNFGRGPAGRLFGASGGRIGDRLCHRARCRWGGGCGGRGLVRGCGGHRLGTAQGHGPARRLPRHRIGHPIGFLKREQLHQRRQVVHQPVDQIAGQMLFGLVPQDRRRRKPALQPLHQTRTHFFMPGSARQRRDHRQRAHRHRQTGRIAFSGLVIPPQRDAGIGQVEEGDILAFPFEFQPVAAKPCQDRMEIADNLGEIQRLLVGIDQLRNRSELRFCHRRSSFEGEWTMQADCACFWKQLWRSQEINQSIRTVSAAIQIPFRDCDCCGVTKISCKIR